MGAIILPAGCFFLLLHTDLPSGVINLASPFRLVHFLGLALVFYLLFQIRGKFALILGCTLAAIVFALPMAARLSSGLSNATVIGGFIPYKDGYYYYNGANMLLSGRLIPQEGLQGAFRPLFPGLVSILLLLTNGNLLLSLELIVLGMAYACIFAAFVFKEEYGPLPGAIFFTLVYAFIRPMIGDTLTELPSLAFACLAFILLFKTAKSPNIRDAILGGVLLILAVSIRAGAFFMLPFLILWLGWLFRGDKKISIKMMVVFSVILLAAFVIFNMLFTRIVTEAGDSTFGNFSWMLYGQAVGGAGWDYHLQALGTHDSNVVMQAALERIREYPLGLLIGFFKSYRDFFTNNSLGMFDLLYGELSSIGWFFWVLMIVLLLYGIFRSARSLKDPRSSLLLACFLGIFFSIPFLPPIDGGSRFHSGSVPFLFALMTFGLPALHLSQRKQIEDEGAGNITKIARVTSIFCAIVIVIGPILILNLSEGQEVKQESCSEDRIVYTARYDQGAYVDILPDDSTACGMSPSLCLSDFEKKGMDKTTDDYFNALVDLGRNSESGIRLWAGVDWNSGQYYYFILPLDLAPGTASGRSFSGCAQGLETQYQRILMIESVD